MQSINSVVLVGNLTRAPELKEATGDTAICSMRLAVNGRRKNNSGDWEDQPNFFNVTAFGKLGENCAQYLSKGRPIAVKGRLHWREWEDQNGNRREAVQVLADDVQFLHSASESGATSQDPGSAAPPRGDDDIPY